VLKKTSWVLALLACGCGLTEGPPSSIRSAVVGGTPADDDPGVVLVVIPGEHGCTATAISERLVLTAKHCTTGTTADQWRVLVGPAPLALETRDAEYLVSEIRETPGDGTEVGEDLAIMLLDSDFEFKTYRWAFAGRGSVVTGAPVRHVGFGNTVAGDSSSAGSRNTRTGSITQVYSQSLNAAVGACPGDSGGPLLAADDVLLGVAHDILTSDCTGDARFTRLEPWAGFIAAALTDTNGCVPTAWEESCDDGVDNDCNGVVDDGCPPVDAGTDAGDDAGGGDDKGEDAGGEDGGQSGDVGPGTDRAADGVDGNGDYTGGVKGGCSTGGFGSGLLVSALVALLALGRARGSAGQPL
jgi:hypothetical protein